MTCHLHHILDLMLRIPLITPKCLMWRASFILEALDVCVRELYIIRGVLYWFNHAMEELIYTKDII